MTAKKTKRVRIWKKERKKNERRKDSKQERKMVMGWLAC